MSSYPTYFSRAGPWFCRRFTWPWSLKCLWFFFFPSALRASSWKCWNFRCPIKGSADIDHFFMVSIACHICSKFGANNINYFSGSQANVWQPFFLSNEPVGFAKKKQNSAAKLATGSKLVVQLGPLYITIPGNYLNHWFWPVCCNLNLSDVPPFLSSTWVFLCIPFSFRLDSITFFMLLSILLDYFTSLSTYWSYILFLTYKRTSDRMIRIVESTVYCVS